MSRNLGVIVLAAGRGSRMKSALPKVLHAVSGKPIVEHVLDAVRALDPSKTAIVVGHEGDAVRAAIEAPDLIFVRQTELLGTADAVRRCRDAMQGCGEVIVVNGDQPLTTLRMLKSLQGQDAPVTILTCGLTDTGRLGRVVRDDEGAVVRVVEAADFDGPPGPGEINAGTYSFDADWLWKHIETVPKSASGEYYLTHLPEMAAAQGHHAATVPCEPDEFLGVDDRRSLAEAERRMRQRVLYAAMACGVTIQDPSTTYIDSTVELSPDVTILSSTNLTGATKVSVGTTIGPNSTLANAVVGASTLIRQSVVENSTIGDRVKIGPFSHVRGGAVIGDDCELGNYAEVKNSVLGDRVKMHHFSYFGDAEVGEDTNIAAGIITCNFDGVDKHRTIIGKRVLLGSDTMLVAPLTVGDDALTAAGSVVVNDVLPGERVAGVPARPMKSEAGEEATE
jgi:bifunctional UDP-N-acetylglucosamine pyrophosphorylase / glucosamine-1-phosphate N-acetyltransferase